MLKLAEKERRDNMPMEEVDREEGKEMDEEGGEHGGEEEDEQQELNKKTVDVHIFWDLDNKRPELDPVGVLERLK